MSEQLAQLEKKGSSGGTSPTYVFGICVAGAYVPTALLNIEDGTINTSAPAVLDGITLSRSGAYVYITSTEACKVISGGTVHTYTAYDVPANTPTIVGSVVNAQVLTGVIYML